MAATAPSRARPAAKPASRRAESESARDAGPLLYFRYHTTMKPQRVYKLLVQVPGRRGQDEDDVPGSLVVVRPVVPGALVQPTEQRFEIAPGNEIFFNVTPLARGRLGQARLEFFAPGQAPERIPLSMTARTQKWALVFLLFAFLFPWLCTKIIYGDWKPEPFIDRKGEIATGEPWELLEKRIKQDFFSPYRSEDPDERTEIPFVNTPIDSLPGALGEFALVDGIAEGLSFLYEKIDIATRDSNLRQILFGAFLLLSFFAWMMCRARKQKTKRRLKLDLSTPAAGREPMMLQPIG